MNIKATFIYPPIPDRRFDWQAIDDDTYDGEGCAIGFGATEREAILDLLMETEIRIDDEDARHYEIARQRAALDDGLKSARLEESKD